MNFFTTSDIINKIAGQTETERGKDIYTQHKYHCLATQPYVKEK